jgi:hypothetical protein
MVRSLSLTPTLVIGTVLSSWLSTVPGSLEAQAGSDVRILTPPEARQVARSFQTVFQEAWDSLHAELRIEEARRAPERDPYETREEFAARERAFRKNFHAEAEAREGTLVDVFLKRFPRGPYEVHVPTEPEYFPDHGYADVRGPGPWQGYRTFTIPGDLEVQRDGPFHIQVPLGPARARELDILEKPSHMVIRFVLRPWIETHPEIQLSRAAWPDMVVEEAYWKVDDVVLWIATGEPVRVVPYQEERP